MKVEINLDEQCPERKVIIVTEAVDAEITELMKRINQEQPQVIAGFAGDRIVLLEPSDIFRIFASNGKTLAVTDRDEFTLRLRLYELEERLDKSCFVRISHSEIINLKQVKNFDLSYAGTIRVALKNGDTAFVSRRYVKKIKQALGL